ncbi:MAG: hypothetical protein Q4B79_04830 [Moraxella sp.]|uniref:hypothetical protein n=1 Tax=Moraxella sp. TaxID=479 RepID=UPI0026DAB335|nr:hypothetical protein [Moraxella sp.]MDO4450268.1 hypothetical protein [Moraxella sp.]
MNNQTKYFPKTTLMASLLCLCMATGAYAQNTAQEPKKQDATSQETTNQEDADQEAPAQPIPKNPHDTDAPTLADLQDPNESELSQANMDLLAKNSELQGRIDELTTQVNVLVNERSGQLFLYGAVSTFMSFVAGFGLAWILANKKQ